MKRWIIMLHNARPWTASYKSPMLIVYIRYAEPACRAVDLHLPPIAKMPASDSKSIRLFLDLGHGWPTFPDTSSSCWHGAARWHDINGHRAQEGSKQEPEECRAGLQFVASLLGVERPISQRVGSGVGQVAAAVYVQLGGKNDASNESEKSCQSIQDDQHNWDSEPFHKGRCKSIEQNYPREHCHKYRIVDARCIASKSWGDDISNQSCDQEGPDELGPSEANLCERNHDSGGWCWLAKKLKEVVDVG